MTPALAAAYVAIVVLLAIVAHLALERRRGREAIAAARACLLVDDDLEAFGLLERALAPPVHHGESWRPGVWRVQL